MSRWDESDHEPPDGPTDGPSPEQPTDGPPGPGPGPEPVRPGVGPRPGATSRVLAVVAGAVVLTLAVVAIVVNLPNNAPGGEGSPPPTPEVTTASPGESGTPTSPGPSATSGPVGGPVPAGFTAVSVTFASTDEGWALGAPPCASGSCTTIVRTTDGGSSWVAIPSPTTPLSEGQGANGPGVSILRFADPLDGWAAVPDLWATHDGGATWTRVTIPGLGADAQVVALETAAGTVHTVGFGGDGSFHIASSPVGSDDWTLSPTTVPVGAGPVPRLQIVLAGTAGWLIEVDRVVIGGARLADGTWTSWQPPCADVLGPALLAASSPSDLVAACDGGVWGPPKEARQTGEHLYVSHDGGATFVQGDASVPLTDPTALAAPDSSAVVLGGSAGQSGTSSIASSHDAGRTWTTSDLGAGATLSYLGFSTPTQGVAIVAGDPAASLLMTRDAGRGWTPVSFTGP